MKKYSLWLLFYFLLFSCKEDNVQVDKKNAVPVVIDHGAAEETLAVKLSKETTLVKRVVSFNENELSEGISEMRLDYVDKDNKPMVVFFFKIDLNNKKNLLKPITPNATRVFAMQSIPEMMQVNQLFGYNIVGAVNSDFFDTTTGEPRSIVYLNKVAVRTTLPTIRSYFGITDNGAPIIGDYAVFASQKITLVDALGGYHRLIKQYETIAQTDNSIHPRTAVGYTENKAVYFLVADGRNAEYSNGLTLAQLALFMKVLGVKDAINLDGGGSSTFVVNTTKMYVRNKPSDGSPRKVANGWGIYVKH